MVYYYYYNILCMNLFIFKWSNHIETKLKTKGTEQTFNEKIKIIIKR